MAEVQVVVNNRPERLEAISVPSGGDDSGKLVELNADGRVDPTLLPDTAITMARALKIASLRA